MFNLYMTCSSVNLVLIALTLTKRQIVCPLIIIFKFIITEIKATLVLIIAVTSNKFSIWFTIEKNSVKVSILISAEVFNILYPKTNSNACNGHLINIYSNMGHQSQIFYQTTSLCGLDRNETIILVMHITHHEKNLGGLTKSKITWIGFYVIGRKKKFNI